MRTFTLTLFFLMGIGIYSFSQPIRFNKYYDTLQMHDFNDIVKTETGYVAIATYFLSTVFVNDSGMVLEIINYVDSGYHHFVAANNLNDANNGNYILSSQIGNGVSGAMQLSMFNTQFDTLWTKKYAMSTTHANILSDCLVANNGYIYATGGACSFLNGQVFSENQDVVILKTDSVGNPEWLKNYPFFARDLGIRIIETSDSCLIIGGLRKYFFGYPPDLTELYLLKTNMDGNMLWQKTLGNPLCADYFSDVIETSDSCLLVAGNFAEYCDSSALSYPYLCKLSLQGDIIWEKKYNRPGKSESFTLLMESGNQIMYAISNEFEPGYGHFNWLYKLTNDGDIIWRRPLKLTGTEIILYAHMHPFRLIEVEDGFVLCGRVYYNGPQRPFLIKTDLNGCDGLYSCQDTAMLMNLYSWEDSVCNGDSVLVSIAIENGNGPFTWVINQSDTIEEPLYIMPDTSSHFFYAHPSLSNPQVEVTIIGPHDQSFTSNRWFNVVDCTLSVEDEGKDMSVRIIPNPATNNIRLDIFKGRYMQHKLEIYNQAGELVHQIPQALHQMNIDIGQMPGGVYYLKLINNHSTCVEKFVIIR